MPCNRYLGFSIRSDFSSDSALSSSKFFTDEVREKVNKRWLLDLKEFFSSTAQIQCHKDLYVGKQITMDVEHARNLSSSKNVTLHELNCGHITLAPLMENNELTSIFNNFIFEYK